MHHKSPSDLGTRRDRLMHERIHDSYKTPHKLTEPTVCPDCGAVYQDGRWQWMTAAPKDAHRTSCQACHRTRDDYPAGLVTLTGDYVLQHQGELRQMVQNLQAKEKPQHPMNRVISFEERDKSLVIKTTDLHLPRLIADALRHEHHGQPTIDYDEEGYFVRVNWRRDL